MVEAPPAAPNQVADGRATDGEQSSSAAAPRKAQVAHEPKPESHSAAGHDRTTHHAHRPHEGGGFDMDFSDVERFAQHFESPERDAWQRPAQVLELMDLAKGQTVADIGAGTGYFVGRLSRAVTQTGRVLALDVEPNMVAYIEKRALKSGWTNVYARVVSPDDPGLSPKSVDRILIVNTWHHIGNRPSYSQKLVRALRPGGAVFVVDFTRDSDVGPPVEHRLAPEKVSAELRAGGLEPEVLKERLPKQYVVRGKLPV